MQVIPLQPVANQTLQIVLNNQNCQLTVFQTEDALFMTVAVNDDDIAVGRICQNLNRIVRDLYLGFIGDFAFNDLQGTSDPNFTGLGSRFQLIYFSPLELT